jgi:hypothetical protein
MTFREVKKTQKAAPKTPDAFSKFPETTGKQSRKNADGRRVVVAVARCRPSTSNVRAFASRGERLPSRIESEAPK